MQLSWLRSPLHRLIAVVSGTAVVAGVTVTVWHQLSATPAASTVYSGVQGTTSTGKGGGASQGNGGGNTNPNGNAPHTFTISGSLPSVFPGQSTVMYLTVDNPNNQAIEVTSLTLRVGDASRACTAANLSPSSETQNFTVVVAKNSSLGGQSFPMPISMSAAAPDACQGATFPITLTGIATGPA